MTLVALDGVFSQNATYGIASHVKMPAKASDGPALSKHGDDHMLQLLTIPDIQSHNLHCHLALFETAFIKHGLGMIEGLLNFLHCG